MLDLACALLALCTGPSSGVALAQEVIREVVFEGETRVARETVLSRLRTTVGTPFAWELADEDRKELFARFAILASCRRESLPDGGVRLVWTLADQEAVRKIEFEGNDALDDEELNQALDLPASGVLPRGFTGEGPLRWLEGRLEERYEEEGYLYAEIRTELSRPAEDLVLTFRVLEGPKVRVDDILFKGLRHFRPRHLRKLMGTKESWLFIRNTFRRQVLEQDLATLENFLHEEGYLDARVALEEMRPSEDRHTVDLVIRIDQGELYRVGEIELSGNDSFTDEELRPLIRLEAGDPYRKADYDRDIARLLRHYGERGYIRASIDERQLASFRLGETIVDMRFTIDEDQIKRIRDVNIHGNVTTSDSVIRRELFFYPGEVFNLEELEYSQDRLRASRLFLNREGLSKVFITHEATEDPRFEDVDVEVEEGDTGFLNFIGGYGSGSGPFVGIAIDKENFDYKDLPSGPIAFFEEFFEQRAFHGAGQRLALRANPGARFSNYSLGFTEPALGGPLEHPWSLDLDVYYREALLRLYDEDRAGGTLSIGKALSRDAGVGIGVRNERIRISRADPQVPDFVAAEGGHTVRGLLGTATFRRLDSLRNPTQGFTLSWRGDWIGGPFGADVDAYKLFLGGEFLHPLYENEEGQRHLLQLRSSVAYAKEYGDTEELPFFERYRAGGLSQLPLRGFDFWGVGPHQAGEPVGGKGGVVVNTDYVFPIYEYFDSATHENVPVLKGVVFLDQGILEPDWEDIPDGLWRSSVGVGIRLRIPIQILSAPLEMYYGIPIQRDRQDEREGFTLSFSTRF